MNRSAEIKTMTDLERLYQILERRGMGNVNDLAYRFNGLSQVPRRKYSGLDRCPTEDEYKHVRKLIRQGRKAGRIRKLGSGRWTQYELIKE